MTLTIVAEAPPLQVNEDGVILVGKTRVTLDTIVAVFNQGATAEEIAHRYPSLNLADVCLLSQAPTRSRYLPTTATETSTRYSCHEPSEV